MTTSGDVCRRCRPPPRAFPATLAGVEDRPTPPAFWWVGGESPVLPPTPAPISGGANCRPKFSFGVFQRQRNFSLCHGGLKGSTHLPPSGWAPTHQTFPCSPVPRCTWPARQPNHTLWWSPEPINLPPPTHTSCPLTRRGGSLSALLPPQPRCVRLHRGRRAADGPVVGTFGPGTVLSCPPHCLHGFLFGVCGPPEGDTLGGSKGTKQTATQGCRNMCVPPINKFLSCSTEDLFNGTFPPLSEHIFKQRR